MSTTNKRGRRSFGSVRTLPSGRVQAQYTGPDGARHKAPQTFPTELDADGWLLSERRLIDLNAWTSPAERQAKAKAEVERDSLTVKALCDRWLGAGHLKRSTVESHQRTLNNRVLNTALADVPIHTVDRARVIVWWDEVQRRWPTTAQTNAQAYRRLHTAFQYAVDEMEALEANPVRVKGAGRMVKSETRNKPLITLTEAQALTDGIHKPLRVPMQLLLWTGLRIGELLELRRKDIHGLSGKGPVELRVRRNAQRMKDPDTKKQVMVPFDTPKSDAGNRTVGVPGKVATALRDHCKQYVGKGPEALIVTTAGGKQMLDTTFRERMKQGKTKAGRDDVTPHDCRRFYGTMLLTQGTSLEEARRLMGHENFEQLLEYQRAASGYEQRAADTLNNLVNGS